MALNRIFARLVLASMVAAFLANRSDAQPAAAQIDLKLFEKSEIDRSKGCSFVLWQDGRDPDKDRYAYAFAETLGRNHARENARVKVGAEVLVFRRVAVGGAKEFGYKSFPYALYRMEKEASFLILDLKLEDSPGEVVDVNGGTMTIIRPRMPPFVVNVKGNGGCNTPAAAPPPQKQAAVSPPARQNDNSQKRLLRANEIVPKIRAELVKTAGCDDALLRQGGGTVHFLSEEAAIWELTCQRYAYQASTVFLYVYTPDPAQNFTVLRFDAPRGRDRKTDPHEMFDARFDPRTKIVTGIYRGSAAGDCGIFERYRFGNEGKFDLIEFREKPACDGRGTEPKDFPLVYRR